MPKFNDLYNDKRFIHVSPQTKTDIISTIGIDVNEAKDDLAESRFTRQELMAALHYLLATEAKHNPNVKRLVVRESPSSSSYNVGSPFYFGNNDPLLWYWSGYHSGYSHSHHHHGGGGGCMDLGGGSNGGNNEGIAIVVALACVCAAGCCCVTCMARTVEGPESDAVINAKVTVSTVTGVAVFVVLLWHLIQNDIWRSSLVDDYHWDLDGYRFFLTLVSAFSGLLASGTVSTVNNIWRCLPSPDREIPQPSAAVLAALNDLGTIKIFLSKGWSRPGDNKAECNAFIREVVLAYIDAIACAPAPVVRVDIPPSPSSSRSTTFGRTLLVPSAPSMPANDSYVVLPDHEDEATAKSSTSPSAPPAYK
jgi:hypothetical protein